MLKETKLKINKLLENKNLYVICMLFYHTYSITYTNCLLWQSQIKCIKLLVLVWFIWRALSIAKLSVLYAAFMYTKTNNSVHSCVLSYLGTESTEFWSSHPHHQNILTLYHRLSFPYSKWQIQILLAPISA